MKSSIETRNIRARLLKHNFKKRVNAYKHTLSHYSILTVFYSVKYIMQRHCRHHPESSGLGKKKGERLLLERTLRLRLLHSGPVLDLTLVGLHANPEMSCPTVRPNQSYKSKPLICSVPIGKSFSHRRMQSNLVFAK